MKKINLINIAVLTLLVLALAGSCTPSNQITQYPAACRVPLPEQVTSREQAAAKYGRTESEIREHLTKFYLDRYYPGYYFVRPYVWVNRDLVVPLTYIFNALESADLLGEIDNFRGCYNYRTVRGSDRLSTHAYGLACDFSNVEYSDKFISIWKKYGFTWGGTWCTIEDTYGYDPMHFSRAWEQDGECRRGVSSTED